MVNDASLSDVTSRLSERRRVKGRARLERELEDHRQHLLDTWNAKVPEVYQGFSLDVDLSQNLWNGRLNKAKVKRVESLIDNPTDFIIMRGTEGLGKTSLASTLVSHYVSELGWSSRYVTAPMLLHELSFNGVEPINETIAPKVLLLDDVGARSEVMTDHQSKGMWAIVNGRYGAGKCTIITTNMGIATDENGIGLKDWFGESAWARIKESLTLIEFSGSSFRSAR